MNLTFRQLRVFLEVARHGSMARAAEALHLTPPAVSMQIKELESQVGLVLFDRRGRTVALSTPGEYFVIHARRMVAALRDAEHAMAKLQRLEQGALTIGMVSTAKYFVPRLLARFHEEHAAIDIRLRVANNREQLVAMMQDGEIDLSIMGRAPQDIGAHADTFSGHPFVFVAAPTHRLAGRRHISHTVIEKEALIARERGSGTRDAMQTFLVQHAIEPRITMEIPSNEAIKQAVMAGMGLSFLSLHTIGFEAHAGLIAVLDVDDTPVMRRWNVVHLSAKVLSPAAEAFRYFVLEHGEAHLAAHDKGLLRRSRSAAKTRASRR